MKKITREKTVAIDTSNSCSGCGCCQLACSFVKTGAFNPAKAYVKLRHADGKERYCVFFTDECDNCGFCAKYCYYGVIRELQNA